MLVPPLLRKLWCFCEYCSGREIALLHRAAVVRAEQPVRQLPRRQRAGVEQRRGADRRAVRLLGGVLDEADLQHLRRRERAGELHLAAAVRVGAGVAAAVLRERVRRVRLLEPAGAEEPEAVLEHRAAERALVRLAEDVGVLDVAGALERRLRDPRRVARGPRGSCR